VRSPAPVDQCPVRVIEEEDALEFYPRRRAAEATVRTRLRVAEELNRHRPTPYGALEQLPQPSAAALPALQTGDELAGAFLLSKREPTRSAYRRDLADFATFLAATGVQPLAVRRVHVDAYARMLERHGAAATTIARRLACLSGFYAYALGEELVARNPVEHVDRPQVGDDSQTLGPDRDQARALLGAADQASPRDRALAYLLAHLGLRVSEALGLDAEDVMTTRGHRTVWITRKRGRRQQLALSPACAQALDALLAQRPQGAGHGLRPSMEDSAEIVETVVSDGQGCTQSGEAA